MKMGRIKVRIDGRENLEFRKMKFIVDYLKYPLSSVLGILGDTIVLVSVNLSENLPDFCKAFGHGWITAEYRLLPASTSIRNPALINSRAQEIKRMIGRSLRSAFDLYKFPKFYFIVDCDVLQADGGTRVACINSAFIALVKAFDKLVKEGAINENPLVNWIAAMSFVIENEQILLDPCYLEDSSADIDLNIVVNNNNQISELQFSAEKKSITKHLLNQIIDISFEKAKIIFDLQKEALSFSDRGDRENAKFANI